MCRNRYTSHGNLGNKVGWRCRLWHRFCTCNLHVYLEKVRLGSAKLGRWWFQHNDSSMSFVKPDEITGTCAMRCSWQQIDIGRAYRSHANWGRPHAATLAARAVSSPHSRRSALPPVHIPPDTTKFIAPTIYIIDVRQKSESAHPSNGAEFSP